MHQNHSRRSFVARCGTTVVAGFLAPDIARTAGPELAGIVDCHFHLWARDRVRFPYQPDAAYTPEYVSTADEWDGDRRDAGIAMGIFVSGAPYGDNPAFLRHSLSLAPDTLRGVCLVNPNVPGGADQLARIVEGQHIVGVRLQTSWLWGVDWDSPHLDMLWRRVGDLGLVLQMHLEPEFNPRLLEKVGKFPGTKVVIDHLGRPRNGTGADYMLLKRIAEHEHVFMKLSSFDTESEQDPPYESIQPVVEELVEWFTPSRCVWGSNNYRGDMDSAGYRELFEHAQWLLRFLPPEDQRAIFCENPYRLYRLKS